MTEYQKEKKFVKTFSE